MTPLSRSDFSTTLSYDLEQTLNCFKIEGRNHTKKELEELPPELSVLS